MDRPGGRVLNFFEFFVHKDNNKMPDYIENHLSEMLAVNILAKACQTKYREWIIVSRDSVDDGFLNIWISIFKRKKLYNKIPMHILIKNKTTVKILDIKVLGKDRSKGYGTIFLDELFEIIEENKLKRITGHAERPDDPILIKFYKKFEIEIVKDQLMWESEDIT